MNNNGTNYEFHWMVFNWLQYFHDTSYEEGRADILFTLSNYIDTSGEHWKQWVEMGE